MGRQPRRSDRVIVSIGAALVRVGESEALLIDRADGAMLAAKNAGRNRSRIG